MAFWDRVCKLDQEGGEPSSPELLDVLAEQGALCGFLDFDVVSEVLHGNNYAVGWLITLQQVNSSRKVVPIPRNVEGNDSDYSEWNELSWDDDDDPEENCRLREGMKKQTGARDTSDGQSARPTNGTDNFLHDVVIPFAAVHFVVLFVALLVYFPSHS